MNKITIRTATEKDILIISRLLIDVWDIEKPDYGWTIRQSRKFFDYLFSQPNPFIFVAQKNCTVIGVAAGLCVYCWEGACLINTEIFVHPNVQNQGISKKLLIALLTQARRQKIQFIEGQVYNKNEFPLSYYNKIGIYEQKDVRIVFGDIKKSIEIIKNINRDKPGLIFGSDRGISLVLCTCAAFVSTQTSPMARFRLLIVNPSAMRKCINPIIVIKNKNTHKGCFDFW